MYANTNNYIDKWNVKVKNIFKNIFRKYLIDTIFISYLHDTFNKYLANQRELCTFCVRYLHSFTTRFLVRGFYEKSLTACFHIFTDTGRPTKRQSEHNV